VRFWKFRTLWQAIGSFGQVFQRRSAYIESTVLFESRDRHAVF
jgi:hypothetical protein